MVVNDRWKPFRNLWQAVVSEMNSCEGSTRPFKPLFLMCGMGEDLSSYGNHESEVWALSIRPFFERESYKTASLKFPIVIGVVIVFSHYGYHPFPSITRPIQESVAFAEVLAEGDLTQEITKKRKDEMGKLFASLNQASSSSSPIPPRGKRGSG